MATNKQTTVETTAEAAKGWAAEKARAMAGNDRAAGRFARLADVLLSAELAGERVLPYAEANKRAGLNRGATGDAAASWRLALQRTRQLCDVGPWRVEAEAGRLVLDK
jgi:hypothetical protein